MEWKKHTHTHTHQTDNEFFVFSQSAVEHNEWQDKRRPQQQQQRQQQSLWYTNKSMRERELSDYESLEMYVFKRFYYYGLFFCLGFSFSFSNSSSSSFNLFAWRFVLSLARALALACMTKQTTRIMCVAHVTFDVCKFYLLFLAIFS